MFLGADRVWTGAVAAPFRGSRAKLLAWNLFLGKWRCYYTCEMTSYVARLAVFITLFAVLVSSVAHAGPPAESAARESVSIGTAMDGSLENGQVLPKKGSGYRLRGETVARKARFGTAELVGLVEDASHRVAKRYPGSVVVVGDLSGPRGGDLDHHGSHCSGRDADFLFFVRDSKGKSRVNADFVPMDGNGYSTDPPMAMRLDIERNWALIEALLTSKRAAVQWIFVSDKIKDLLLAHAEATGVSVRLLGIAKQMLRQPGFKAHVDHFHVRVFCSAADKPRCVDTGPRWAWVR